MDKAEILDRLAQVIAARKGGDATTSYVAKLFQRGRKKIAQKVGEEGVETALAAVLDDREEVISESADLMFHLMVLWADMDITAEDIFTELARREGLSGIDEKNAREE
ncbi:MAG: phosphoribosyl-ATP diphosphatase [Alphaproteobacteria bacterium]|nr:MAG: phosphoribosyl-ATP diphosphatase [Alphaproteobacteria bacterium]